MSGFDVQTLEMISIVWTSEANTGHLEGCIVTLTANHIVLFFL
jgi:hypothetical protein